MLNVDKDRVFGHIIEEHISNATFLWMLRDVAVNQAHHTPTTLGKLETRINKHLKGCLAASPEVAWEYALQAAEIQEGGESFVLASLAFNHPTTRKIERALEMGSTNHDTCRGLVSALAWLPDAIIFPWLQPWMHSDEPLCRYLAVAVCSVRRLDPQDHLTALLRKPISTDSRLLSRLLRLTGELKRYDLLPFLHQALAHDDADVKFWASWASLILGDQKALAAIQPYIHKANPHQLRAIATALRCMNSDQAWSCINRLIQTPGQMAKAIAAVGVLGDPHGMSWLFSRMEQTEHAQMAGEIFTLITGIDLAREELYQLPASASLNLQDADVDEANEMPNLQGYESLPVPDVTRVADHWQSVRQQFKPGSRYFLGRPIAINALERSLVTRRQSQRLWAAQELSTGPRERPLPNIKALQDQGP